MQYSNIFKPIKIGPVTSKNRIEVGPASPFLANRDGSCSIELYEYERQLAASGAGIVNIGISDVDPEARQGLRILNPGIMENQTGLNDLAELFHSYNTLAGIELVYLKYMIGDPEETVNNLTTEEIEDIIKCFANAAKAVSMAGFDVIFVHGGHGNIPAQFFSQKYNHRTDRFGGSFEGRCQFAIELLQALREAAGPRVALEYRISAEEILPGYTTFEETLEFAKVIQSHIDMLHVSRGILEIDELLHWVHPPLYLPRAMNLPFAKKFKEELDIPVTCIGSFNLDLADEAIGNGEVDMISMVRAFLAEPRMIEKVRHDQVDRIRPCLRCNTCINRTHEFQQEVRCAVNPLLTRETRFDINRQTGLPNKTDAPKHVAVIGAGPAGMQAAITLQQRGHKPVLFEKSDKMGGLLCIAAQDVNKSEIGQYVNWLKSEVAAEGVEVRMNTEATPEMLKAEPEPFDAVILACGSNPIIPRFSQSTELPVFWVGDPASKGEGIGENVLIAGAGLTGLECALDLAKKGKKVYVADGNFITIPAGGVEMNVRCLYEQLEKYGVKIMLKSMVDGVCPEGAILKGPDGSTRLHECDSLIFSFGFRANNEMLQSFEEAFVDCYRIGDCMQKVCNIYNATSSAYNTAMHL